MRIVISTCIVFLLSLHMTVHAQIPNHFGAKGALQDQSIDLNKAITYALEDEFLAQVRYDVIMEQYGTPKPFTEIQFADKENVKDLLYLAGKYDISVPTHNANAEHYVVRESSLRQAFKTVIHAEHRNISMYDKFLREYTFPKDVMETFMDIREDSRRHLLQLKSEMNKL
ncbi:hypothetical protein [Salirhabdus salicampi]|uniref:hypothetical protein n=1 Tax=Salirhabdus salicampi TaxID=476102 RepID=UPI0020C3C86C|nr:hypothetical protein [Salirhabdus salicampi]MCP8615764.1 hypothetical protein [Salirhabdus salicampi]